MATSRDTIICVFACRWCSLLGAERAGRARLPLPPSLRVIPVPCAGSVSADMVMQAFVNGADGVAVLGCHLGGCRHNDANRDEHVRLEVLADLLESVGIDRRRLLVSWGTAHEAEQYAQTMRDFAESLDALLPMPEMKLTSTTYVPFPHEGAGGKGRSVSPEVKEKVLAALREGRAVLGLVRARGVVPGLVFTEEEVENMASGVRYPLAKLAGRILKDRREGSVQGNDHVALREEALECGLPLSIVCTPCDARALKEQIALRQFCEEDLHLIVESCSEEQQKACRCERPEWPGDGGSAPEKASVGEADLPAVSARWQEAFSRCVQCYWCRSVCPVCVCPSCALDRSAVLPAGKQAVSPLGYHLTRAMHVADVCVQCGACQAACPQGLPLLELHQAVARSLKKHGYASGEGALSPMLGARRLGDAKGISAPEWKSTGGGKA